MQMRYFSIFSLFAFMAYIISDITLGDLKEAHLKARQLKTKPQRYNAFIKKGSRQAKAMAKFGKKTHIDFDDYEFMSLDLEPLDLLKINKEFDPNDTTQILIEDFAISLPNDTFTYSEGHLRSLATSKSPTRKPSKVTAYPTLKPSKKPTLIPTAKPSRLSTYAPTPKIAVTSMPKYDGEVKGVVFFIDTLLQNIPSFDGFNISVHSNFVEPEPCASHGTSMIEVFTQQFNPEKAKNLKIFNLAAFNCNGYGDFSTLAASIQAIRGYIKKYPKSKIVVNFSATTEANNMIDLMFKTLLPNVHINTASANGNGKDCKFYSPARIAANTAVQSIGAMEGQNIAPYSSVATNTPCVTLYLIGTFPVTNIWTLRPGIVTGTSPACALQSARTIVYMTQHPNSTPAKTKAAMTSKLNSFIFQQGSLKARTITKDMAYSWQATPTKKPVRRKLNFEA